MTTEMEPYRPPAAPAARDTVDGWIQIVGDAAKLADTISMTDFVPRNLRGKPAAITACFLTGRELGIGPMQSLKSINMVDGSPSLAADYKRARALAAGHTISYPEITTTRCVVRGRRKGSEEWTTVTWSMDDAQRAKLAGKGNWQSHPRRMLEARATGELCDLLFPDCTLGLPTTEELEDGDSAAAAPAPSANGHARTARRRTAARQDAKDGETARKPQPQPEQPSEAAAAGPPLPGEEGYDQPAEDENREDRSTEPGSATKPQLTKLGTIFTEYGFGKDEREQRLTVAEQVIGRDLTGPNKGRTSANLSMAEAGTLIDTLESCGSRDNLIELLSATPGVSPAGGDGGE